MTAPPPKSGDIDGDKGKGKNARNRQRKLEKALNPRIQNAKEFAAMLDCYKARGIYRQKVS